MALVRATCDSCGDVELKSHDIWTNRITDGAVTILRQYGFQCPACRQFTLRPADEHVISVLRATGVVMREIDARSVWPTGVDLAASPFNHDDLLEFHRRLWGSFENYPPHNSPVMDEAAADLDSIALKRGLARIRRAFVS
ncbi:MAG: hypothetical protein U0526_04105 [Candidatus Saccharibacteria bacterium]